MTELFCENSQRPKHVDSFGKNVPPQTSDRTLNADPTGGAVNVGCWWDGMQVRGIRSCRLVCKEVVEAPSDYEK